jgi:hypothetical protein
MPNAGVVVVRNISSVILNRTEDILLPGRMRVVGLVADGDSCWEVSQIIVFYMCRKKGNQAVALFV